MVDVEVNICCRSVLVVNSVNYIVFFFQAEDGIRDSSTSRGLGDVYKRQIYSIYYKQNLHQKSPGVP
ncbi:hypothetical protein MUDAN_IGPPGNFN_00534 [Lactiplantibacillus mudanjiangensis]|nr:hypothetical protein MUDAN_IGPPGNFN_00534 [Lactiplantibacillus mudanjiangensis]